MNEIFEAGKDFFKHIRKNINWRRPWYFARLYKGEFKIAKIHDVRFEKFLKNRQALIVDENGVEFKLHLKGIRNIKTESLSLSFEKKMLLELEVIVYDCVSSDDRIIYGFFQKDLLGEEMWIKKMLEHNIPVLI